MQNVIDQMEVQEFKKRNWKILGIINILSPSYHKLDSTLARLVQMEGQRGAAVVIGEGRIGGLRLRDDAGGVLGGGLLSFPLGAF